MTTHDRILRRTRAHGPGNWVYTPKDFLDLGTRAAIDQALARLALAGQLRRIGHGLYDLPRFNKLLGRVAAPGLQQVVDALARRDNIRIMRDGIGAANDLGLTNAVPARVSYVTDGRGRIVKAGGWEIRLRHASPKLMQWAGRPGAPIVQALLWLGPRNASDPQTLKRLARVSDAIKRDLADGIDSLPGWALPIAQNIIKGEAAV